MAQGAPAAPVAVEAPTEEWRARALSLAQGLGPQALGGSPEAQLLLAAALLPPLKGYLPCGKFDWSPPRMLVNSAESPLSFTFLSLEAAASAGGCEFCFISSQGPPPEKPGLRPLQQQSAARLEGEVLRSDVVMLVDERLGAEDVMLRFMDEATPRRPEPLSLEGHDFIPLARVLKPLPSPSEALLQQDVEVAAPSPAPAPVPVAEEVVETEDAVTKRRRAAHRGKKQKEPAEAPPAAAEPPSEAVEEAEALPEATRSAGGGLSSPGKAKASDMQGKCQIQLRPVGRRFSLRPLSSVIIHVL